MRATSPVLFRASLLTRSHANLLASNRNPPIVSIDNATFYKHHPAVEDSSNRALFHNLTFSLPSFSETAQYWSIISPSSTGKTTFLEILRGQHICIPPTARTYPYLVTEDITAKDPHLRVPGRALQYVGFNAKSAAPGGSGIRGAYLSARYESRRESTDFSLLDYLKGSTHLNPSEDEVARGDGREIQETLHRVIRQLMLEPFLGMPVGNLSNGQTRRAKIAKALMGKPEVLLLDEPFMGLDPPTLSTISSLLYRLAEKHSPRVVLALRPQDPLPEWITHLIYLDSDTSVAYQGPKEGAVGELISQTEPSPHVVPFHEQQLYDLGKKNIVAKTRRKQSRIIKAALTGKKAMLGNEDSMSTETLVEMKGVEVKYGEKQVLGAWKQVVDGQRERGLWWTVRRGERWGVFGPNGSGKTTLLSLICSDHPQTYSLPIKLFGHSRLPNPGQPGISVFDLQARIGHSSPEVHAFFPRHLTVRQTLENAWADTFRGKAVLSYENDIAVEACLRFFECELNPNASELERLLHMLLSDLRKSRGPLNKSLLKKRLDAYFERDVDWADNVRFGDLSISAQRVALFLRAFVKKPDLVILDEAFSGMDAVARDKCMLFLAHGENYILNTQHGAWKAEKSNLALEDSNVSNQITVTGLERRQALICISHLKEEVPILVTDWLCLPEPNGGEAVRFGKASPMRRGRSWWDKVWKTKV